MHRQLWRLLAGVVLSVCAWCSHAAVIGFDDIGANGAQFSTYSEDGFNVTAGSSLWQNNRIYGHPAPFVQFWRQREDPEITTGLYFDAGGLDFTFGSVDLYSSVTPIPYRIRGYQDSVVVFDLIGTAAQTFGGFRTVYSDEASSLLIDRLYILLTNPYMAIGGNPMGMDNVSVTRAQAVPEPDTLSLLLVAAMAIAAALRGQRPARP